MLYMFTQDLEPGRGNKNPKQDIGDGKIRDRPHNGMEWIDAQQAGH